MESKILKNNKNKKGIILNVIHKTDHDHNSVKSGWTSNEQQVDWNKIQSLWELLTQNSLQVKPQDLFVNTFWGQYKRRILKKFRGCFNA